MSVIECFSIIILQAVSAHSKTFGGRSYAISSHTGLTSSETDEGVERLALIMDGTPAVHALTFSKAILSSGNIDTFDGYTRCE